MKLEKIKYYKLNKSYDNFVTRGWGQQKPAEILNNTHIISDECYIIKDRDSHRQPEFSKLLETLALTSLINKIKSLNGIKNVKFAKDVRFNRSLFKEMYPSVNVRRDIEKAEAIIFDDKKHNASLMLGVYEIQPNLYVDYYLGVLLSETQKHTVSKIDDIEIDKVQCKKFESYANRITQYAYPEFYINQVINDFSGKVPYIHISDVFESAETKMRAENIALEEITTMWQQITHSEINIRRLGADLIASLDTKKYLPLQVLIWDLADTTGIKSSKVDVFRKYLRDHHIDTSKPKSNYYWSHGSFEQRPLQFISNTVACFGEKPFTADMDYEIFSEFINKVLLENIKKNLLGNAQRHIDLSQFEIKVIHPITQEAQPQQVAVCAEEISEDISSWTL